MNIATASALIASQFQAGLIDSATAQRAQAAIRSKKHYGKTMSNDDRRRMLANRFGIAQQAAA